MRRAGFRGLRCWSVVPFALLLAACSSPVLSEPALMRRLTPGELERTVADLHEVSDVQWEDWVEDERPFGFEGSPEGQVVSALQVEQVASAAHHFASQVLEAPGFWSCDAHSEPACVERSLQAFTERAWRGPLTSDELDRLLTFHRDSVASDGLEAGIELTVEGVLVSPRFLFRLEPEGVSIDDWAQASRLSYARATSTAKRPTCSQAAAGTSTAAAG
jgi:hypothetical protein